MLIELINASYSYLEKSPAEKKAVIEISLTIKAGEFVALIGPTGSGKSTLAQIIAGLIKPTSGRIIYGGASGARATGRTPLAGIIFQEPERQLFELSVAEDIAFWPRNLGFSPSETAEMVARAMSSVGLSFKDFADRSPFSLSGGEMRRAAAAGIIAARPKLLILDEPTAGLDPRGRAEFMEQISALNSAGTTVLLISHDMDQVAELADRAVMMVAGRKVLDGPIADVFDQHELLLSAGLGLPQVTELALELAASGFEFSKLPLTLDELELAVVASLQGARR